MFFGIKIIVMKSIVTLKEGRILLDQVSEQQKQLYLKVCVGTKIHKYDDLTWNEACSRWEITSPIQLTWTKNQTIELQLYYPSRSIPQVVGQASISSLVISSHLEEELKIALTYDGLIKGWLYCVLEQERPWNKSSHQKYLYIHKISLFFLEEWECEFDLQIFQNQTCIYDKRFIPSFNSKSLFPNIRKEIRYSDVIRLTLHSSQGICLPICILVDKIKRGKTTYFQTWIRNKHNNKIGDCRLEYFLENLFLDNERQVLSRKPVYPQMLQKISTLITENLHSKIDKTTNQDMQSKSTGNQSFQKMSKIQVEELCQREKEKENKDLEEVQEDHQSYKRSIKTRYATTTPKLNNGTENAIRCLNKIKSMAKIVKKQRKRPSSTLKVLF